MIPQQQTTYAPILPRPPRHESTRPLPATNASNTFIVPSPSSSTNRGGSGSPSSSTGSPPSSTTQNLLPSPFGSTSNSVPFSQTNENGLPVGSGSYSSATTSTKAHGSNAPVYSQINEFGLPVGGGSAALTIKPPVPSPTNRPRLNAPVYHQTNETSLPAGVGSNFSTPAATNSRSPIRAPTNRPVSNAPVYPQFNQTSPPVVSGSSSNAATTSQSPVPGPIPAPHDEEFEGIYIKSGSNSFVKLNDRQLDQLGKQLMVRVIHTDITGLKESHIGMQKDVIKFRRYEIFTQTLREDFAADVSVFEGKLEELQGLSKDKWNSEKQVTIQTKTTPSTSQNGNVAVSQLPNVASVTRGDSSSVVLHSGNPSQTDMSSRNAAATTSAPSLPAPSLPEQTNSGENTDNSYMNTGRKRKSTATITSRSRKPKTGTTNVETTMVASSSTTQISTQGLGAEPSSMASELGQQQSEQVSTTAKKKTPARKPRAKKTPAVAVSGSNLVEQAPHGNASIAASVSATAVSGSTNLRAQAPLENANGVSEALPTPSHPTNPAIINRFLGQNLMNSLAFMAANGLAGAPGDLPFDSGLHMQNVHTSSGLQPSFNAPPYFGQSQQNPVQLNQGSSTSSLNPTQTYFNNNTFVQMPHQHNMNPGRQGSNVFVNAAAPVPASMPTQPTSTNNSINNNNNNAFVQMPHQHGMNSGPQGSKVFVTAAAPVPIPMQIQPNLNKNSNNTFFQTPHQHRMNFGPQGSDVFINSVAPVPAPMPTQSNLNNNNIDEFGGMSRQYVRRFGPLGSNVFLTPPPPTQGTQTASTEATPTQPDPHFNFNLDEVIADAANADISSLETDVSQPSAQNDLTSLDNTSNHFWEHLWNVSAGLTDLLDQPMALPPLNNSMIQDIPDLATSPAFGSTSTSTRQKRAREEGDEHDGSKKHRTSQN
ncbi:hypothetical protein HDU76_005619 [Blyttiomyces sp. JEL0837]|nr:hypothetical protein HDU76_005619 [Blyttiomyces sp. JEL0837]